MSTTMTPLSPDLIAVAYNTPRSTPDMSLKAWAPGVCTTCHSVVKLTARHDEPAYINRHGIRVRDYLTVLHGPTDNRCEGSNDHPLRWMDAAGLPSWDDMRDLDRGAALMHLWKAKREGGAYAREHYPCRYVVDPRLTALSVREACRHAGIVGPSYHEVCDRLGDVEVARLYDLAQGGAR